MNRQQAATPGTNNANCKRSSVFTSRDRRVVKQKSIQQFGYCHKGIWLSLRHIIVLSRLKVAVIVQSAEMVALMTCSPSLLKTLATFTLLTHQLLRYWIGLRSANIRRSDTLMNSSTTYDDCTTLCSQRSVTSLSSADIHWATIIRATYQFGSLSRTLTS